MRILSFAVFDDLLRKATDGLQHINKGWTKDVQEELDDLSKGIVRNNSFGWHK
jgi:hypothetical protein